MISYFQIQRLASQKEVSEDIIEKDYFIELILYYLSDDDFLNEINSESYKKLWKIRLDRQVKSLPQYELVIDQLEKLIKDKLF
jgi:hypothetical protein